VPATGEQVYPLPAGIVEGRPQRIVRTVAGPGGPAIDRAAGAPQPGCRVRRFEEPDTVAGTLAGRTFDLPPRANVEVVELRGRVLGDRYGLRRDEGVVGRIVSVALRGSELPRGHAAGPVLGNRVQGPGSGEFVLGDLGASGQGLANQREDETDQNTSDSHLFFSCQNLDYSPREGRCKSTATTPTGEKRGSSGRDGSAAEPLAPRTGS